MTDSPLLEVDGLTRQFGGFTAIDRVSFQVHRGESVGIIGPNGAGKTTLFNLLSGLEAPTTGIIRFKGSPIVRGKPHLVARAGLGRTFQIVRVFGGLTLMENLMVGGMHGRSGVRAFDRQRALELLELVRLEKYRDYPAADLSYGQQKLLELTVVLMSEPDLLLLDEPVAGVTPALINVMGELLQYLLSKGLTLLLVEHNVPFVVQNCSRVIVLNFGEKIADGSGAEIQQDHRVLEAYLGGV